MKMCRLAWRLMDSSGAPHSCYQERRALGWGPQHDVPEAVHSRGRSRELLEQAFDTGINCVYMRNLLVLFHVDSKFLPHFLPSRSGRDRSCCHCDSCHWSSDGVLVSLRLRGEESTTALSFNEWLVFFTSLGFTSFVFGS